MCALRRSHNGGWQAIEFCLSSLRLSWSCSHTLSTGHYFKPAQSLIKKYTVPLDTFTKHHREYTLNLHIEHSILPIITTINFDCNDFITTTCAMTYSTDIRPLSSNSAQLTSKNTCVIEGIAVVAAHAFMFFVYNHHCSLSWPTCRSFIIITPNGIVSSGISAWFS